MTTDSGSRRKSVPGTTLRRLTPSDWPWLVDRHRVLYSEEHGYAPLFATYVTQSVEDFCVHEDASRDRVWIAEDAGERVASIGIQHDPRRPGWGKLRWFLVEPTHRGSGLGHRLMSTALGFARACGYEGVHLWTVNDLSQARKMYQRNGFVLVEETESCPWAPWGKEQRWELLLSQVDRQANHA